MGLGAVSYVTKRIMPECQDLGRKNVSWQSTVTAQISLKRLKLQDPYIYESWESGGILAPHLEVADTRKNRQKVINFLNSNIGKKGLVPVRDIASELRLTEEFVLIALQDIGMEIVDDCEGD